MLRQRQGDLIYKDFRHLDIIEESGIGDKVGLTCPGEFFKDETLICLILRPSSYRAVNILSLDYTNRYVNAV
jgi:hypothetical protein